MSLKKGRLENIIQETMRKSRTQNTVNEETNDEIVEEIIDEEKEEKKSDPLLAPKGDKKLSEKEQMERRKARSGAYNSIKKEEVEVEDETTIDETAAADSLKPAAKAISDPQALSASKVGRMSGVMSAMSGMSDSDQISFFNSVMGQFGPGKTYGVGDNSEKNKSTLDMKPSDAGGAGPDVKMSMPTINAKEDIDAMFSGEELSEEFKEKVTTLFEAAVNAKVIAEMVTLEEQYEQAITEELRVFTEEVTDKLDAYLDYVVENWMAENEVAVESALRNELAEEFIGGLKNLFAEHYINIPESKVEVVETLASRVEELESQLDESILEKAEMKKVIFESNKKEILESLSEGLALTQQEKLKALAEGIEFDGNVETYEKKLRIIKETYFKNETKPHSSNIAEESFEGEVETIHTNPQMSRYVQALTRTVKR